MENRELSSENTLEDNNRGKKIEQYEEETELPVEKDNSAILLDINEKIEKNQQVIEDIKNIINEIRNGLDLPPTDEVPPSVNTEQEAVIILSQEKNNLENTIQQQNINNESKDENIKIFEGNIKNVIEDISSKSKTLLDSLHERQQQQFTPLQNSDEFQGIVSHLRSIKNFDGKFDINGLSQINENVQKVSSLIGSMNPKNTNNGVRDNPQSLEKLAYGARAFSAALDEASRNLGPELTDDKMEEKRKELRRSLGLLSEQTQKLNSLALRMRANFY